MSHMLFSLPLIHSQDEAARLELAACLQHSPHSTTLLCGGQPAPPLLFTYCSLHHTLVLNAAANLWAGLPEPLHHTALAWAQQAATCMVRYQYDMRAMSDVAPAFLAALYRLGVQHKQLARQHQPRLHAEGRVPRNPAVPRPRRVPRAWRRRAHLSGLRQGLSTAAGRRGGGGAKGRKGAAGHSLSLGPTITRRGGTSSSRGSSSRASRAG